MKAQADKNRTKRSFEEGQLVYLKLQPYLQSSVVSRTHQKLSFRYYGPYKILQKVGKVAYRLDLPPDAKIHLVVHVSLLKQFVATADVVSQDLSTVLLDSATKLEPAKVLATRNIRKGASVITHLFSGRRCRRHCLLGRRSLMSKASFRRRRLGVKQAFKQGGVL
jgi:hypothetical protein